MNLYNNTHYQPLTPQNLPFDTYPPQSLSNVKNNNRIMSTSSNALINPPQTTVNKSSSTLVNLLHQKRPLLIDQPAPQEKQNISVKQSRKSTQKKTVTKQLSTVNHIRINFILKFLSLAYTKPQSNHAELSFNS